HPGPVEVEQRVRRPVDTAGGGADVSRLTRVLFHVGPLDVHAPGASVLELDVEVTVEGDGLVVLRDLVVLRLVRVEVVLPGEAAVRRDRAVQRETDLDRPLDRLTVGDGPRTRQ